MNIFQKLLKITEELPMVAKNLTVELGKGKGYKAVGEVDVLNAVKPLEVKYGVYSYPIKREVIESKELSTKYDTINQFMRVETTYRFVNVDNPDEYIEVITYGDGVDSQDKASGKAMTYADKYALLKAYKIATGDDPDQEASQEHKKKVEPKATQSQIDRINEIYEVERIPKILSYYKIEKLEDLTLEQASLIIMKQEKMMK